MTTNNYTSRTAALKATRIDSRLINAKSIDASSIILDGKNIEDSFGFQSSEDFKKLYQRSDLSSLEENYTLYTDEGNPVYVDDMSGDISNKFIYQSDITSVDVLDFSKTTNTQSTFEMCEGLKSFKGDLSQLENANSMFYNCTSLESFESKSSLSNLTNTRYMFNNCKNLKKIEAEFGASEEIDGFAMFNGCALNLETTSNILNQIRDGKFFQITLAMDSLLKYTSELDELFGTVIGLKDEGDSTEYETSISEFSHERIKVPFTSGNGNCIVTIDWNNYSKKIDSSYNDITSAWTEPIIRRGAIMKGMFNNNKNLESFSASLENSIDIRYMFLGCENLKSFTSPLPSTTYAGGAFNSCSSLSEFDVEIPLLENGDGMFSGCSSLVRFASEISSLKSGEGMFNNCTSLEIFFKDMPELTDGINMFNGCTSLRDFRSSLPKLTDGTDMFKGCKLDKTSALHIINQLKNVNATNDKNEEGKKILNLEIHIGIDKSLQEDASMFEEIGINVGTTQFTLTNTVGSTWTVQLSFN